ncbi:39S ribosomal protein L39, mitochondrial-like [Paramacrobiotus metropolitanus]|uniref:39S ribosomal protein L39, mitochondrial-like n=1 Tax=Paramacrobiotus metropolitanus TaxID=2943436 RepID=UPI0024458411|nr:39S ribosomal protein L39, mitochondrial-like [Paramacrobiotus metropolitanus]
MLSLRKAATSSLTALLNSIPCQLVRLASTAASAPNISIQDLEVSRQFLALPRTPLPPLSTLVEPAPKTKRTVTNETIRAQRNALFTQEKIRQIESVTRVEKIEVLHRGQPEDVTLIMNKNFSTPLHCAQHISEVLVKRSALAMVDGKPWDMNRPLERDCVLELQHFIQEDPNEANLAFWRTGSLILSYVVDRAFRDDYLVQVHSWPYQDIQSGSFICDVDLDMPEWNPKEDELRALTIIISQLRSRKLPIERLEISADLAMKMFEHNKFKKLQIPVIAEKSPTKDRVVVYRVDDHVEISSGPMIANTGMIGRHQITAVYPIDCHGIGRLYRFQGLAIPEQQPLNYFAWNILVSRARQFNGSPVPINETE